MAPERYYGINNIDGNTNVHEYTKEQLEKKLNKEARNYDQFLESIYNNQTDYWAGFSLIIKGKIIVPKDVKVVIRKEVE